MLQSTTIRQFDHSLNARAKTKDIYNWECLENGPLSVETIPAQAVASFFPSMESLVRKGFLAVALLGISVLGKEFPDCVGGPLASNKVCDVTAPPAERAAALVAAMTFEEKQGNLVE